MRPRLRRPLATLALASLAGCSFATHFEDFEVEAGPLPCASGPLVEGVAQPIDTTDGTNAFSASCGGDASPDTAFEFTAPATTYYRVTTAGSGFDTVLSVRAPSCSASAVEYACNNDTGGLPSSEVIVPIDQDERVLIVVDGNVAQGMGQVTVDRIACPPDTVEASTPINHTTVGRPNAHGGSCGGGGNDHAYRFVATTSGIYAFRAIKNASQTRVAVYVESGPECGGPALGCNAGTDGRAEVVRYVAAGDPVTVWVDALDPSTDGAYTLSVEPRPSVVCGDGPSIPASGMVTDAVPLTKGHNFSTSCAATSVWWNGRTNPTDVHEFPDRTYAFQTGSVPSGCGGACTMTITAHFPFAAEILQGATCAGPVETCAVPTGDFTDPLVPVWTQQFNVPFVLQGGDVDRRLIIDRLIDDYQGGPPLPPPPQADDVSIELLCFGIC